MFHDQIARFLWSAQFPFPSISTTKKKFLYMSMNTWNYQHLKLPFAILCLIPATLERKGKSPAGCRDCRIRFFTYITFISTTGATSVDIRTKITFSFSFYTGQASAKAEKLSDVNKMVWIWIGDLEVNGLLSNLLAFTLALFFSSHPENKDAFIFSSVNFGRRGRQ